jgi:hypothetical protein
MESRRGWGPKAPIPSQIPLHPGRQQKDRFASLGLFGRNQGRSRLKPDI